MLSELEKRIKQEYYTALKGVQKKYDNFVNQFSKDEAEMQARVNAGTITEKEFAQWRIEQVLLSNRWRDMRDVLAKDLTMVDRKVASITNGYTPDAYALNHNFATYEIEKGTSINTSYTLYSRESVERILRDNPKLLPKSKVDIPKDRKWNNQHINSAVTQGILQGDSLSDVSDRLQSVTDMDRRAAIRNARTVMTGAQNAGRMDAYRRMKALGIDVKKKWMATLDHHTRDSHAHLDGETAELDEKFSNGLMYPGDPKGSPSEVYNCRCTMISDFPEYPSTDMERYDNINGKPIGNVTYNEWVKSKPKDTVSAVFKVVNGKDISFTWKRRESQYDFEIEDVINAQGFDGLPRVVSAEEFDEYVKQANGGNGFIAQRTYSAPDQETLDAYRDQLYKGKWYVDCSTGGAQYGQGMYCAADYTGTLSQGIRNEMEHYESLGDFRNSGKMINDVSADTQRKWIDDAITKYYGRNSLNDPNLRTLIESEVLVGSHNWNEVSKAVNALGGYDKVPDMTDILTELRSRRTEYKSYTETMTLDPSAKIITWKEVDQMMSHDNEHDYEWFKSINWDEGIYAALKGYDAINAEEHGQSGSYTVILNRTKVIIRRDAK